MNGRTNGLYDGLLTGQANGLFDGVNNGLNNGLFNNDIVNDFDAQNFINAAASLNQQQQKAINYLVFNLKANNIWDKFDAIYPFVGGTSSTHKWNLKDARDLDAAFRLTFNGGVTHSNLGAVSNGTNGFANTFYNTSIFGIQDNHHLSYYSRTNINTTQVEIGNQTGTSQNLLEIRTSNITYFVINMTSNYAIFTDTNSIGFYIGSRTASNLTNGWKNKIKVATSTAASVTRPTNNIYLFAYNSSGNAALFTTKQCAFASIGKGLNDKEAIIFSNIVQGYQTLLNRAV